MGLITWLKQRYCKHHYEKYWSKQEERYVLRCTKCNKVIEK